MTKKEIIEGNKLIAKFMEIPLCDRCIDKDRDKCDKFKYGVVFYSPIEMEYNSSWNWLMPVVEKIEQLTYRFLISTTFVRVYTCKKSWDDTDEYHTGVFGGKLNATWYAVVEFIKWYNQTNHDTKK